MTVCSICLDRLCSLKLNVKRLECRHKFHRVCIKKHIQTQLRCGTCVTCPLCNDPIYKVKMDSHLLNMLKFGDFTNVVFQNYENTQLVKFLLYNNGYIDLFKIINGKCLMDLIPLMNQELVCLFKIKYNYDFYPSAPYKTR